MYGSTLLPSASSESAGHQGDEISTSKTPLMSNQHRKHDEIETSTSNVGGTLLPPKNYDHNRRMMDLKTSQKEGSRRRASMLGPRAGSVGVFKNVFDEGSSKPKHERRSKRAKQQQQQQSTREDVDNKSELVPTVDRQPAAALQENDTKKSSSQQHHHSFLYSMLNPHSRRWQAVCYKAAITTIIVTDLLMFIASTDMRANAHVPQLFETWEAVVSYIFLIEYCARLYVVTEKKKYHQYGPVCGRVYYAFGNAGAWVDLLAAAPYFVELLTGWDLPTLTILRMFRLFRILKTESYIRALDAVYRVVYYNSEILYVAALICFFLTVSTAMLLYVLRPEHDEENDFGSIAATLYLSTMMLTGQGGPGGELPWYTKSVVLLTSVFSVAIFAIPASMLTWVRTIKVWRFL